jgi:putative exosortase-associated protein (TIGR04073 family)
MTKFARLAVLCGLLLPTCGASDDQISAYGRTSPERKVRRELSYGENVRQKLASGLSNITLGWLEIPKNMIITTNQTNALFGAIGGPAKGALHTAGRSLAGVADLLTFPLPTEPITKPGFVWESFESETQYGKVFQMK